jgi:hypothetical protein
MHWSFKAMSDGSVSGKHNPLLFQVDVPTSIKGLSHFRRSALGYQVEAINLAQLIQSQQLNGSITPVREQVTIEKIAHRLDSAADYFEQDPDTLWDALACRANADALKSGNWEPLRNLYLRQFQKIRQPCIIAPIPAMHNHSVVLSGFVAVVSDNSMTSGLAINHPSQLARLNSTIYPDCPIGIVRTQFVGAHVVKATNIHHPPYFIPEYLPNPPEICTHSVGFLLNTYTAQSVNHTLTALESFWLPEQLAEIRQLFEAADANEVQAALISLHNMTHFLGSQPLNHKNKESATFMGGVDEELRADSGSNVGLDALGHQLFDSQLIKVVILMDILDRAFKYTLAAPTESLDGLLLSHHDAAAGQMRLNALRKHGALKQVEGKEIYYLDYQACLESDRIILAELEALDRLGLESPEAYQIERLEFLAQYLGTNEDKGWKLDPFYYQVRAANPWLSAQLVFDYPVELELLMDLACVA